MHLVTPMDRYACLWMLPYRKQTFVVTVIPEGRARSFPTLLGDRDGAQRGYPPKIRRHHGRLSAPRSGSGRPVPLRAFAQPCYFLPLPELGLLEPTGVVGLAPRGGVLLLGLAWVG